MPAILQKGSVRGIRARGQIGIDQLSWDMANGNCHATFTSYTDQSVKLVMPRDMIVTSITVNKKKMPVSGLGVKKFGTMLSLRS